MKITRTSPLTGTDTTLDLPVTEEQFAAWRGGEFIQVAFANLDAEQREFIKTGYAPGEFDAMLGL